MLSPEVAWTDPGETDRCAADAVDGGKVRFVLGWAAIKAWLVDRLAPVVAVELDVDTLDGMLLPAVVGLLAKALRWSSGNAK
ncbi:hypothetical protein [Leptothrix ochracea]|uniref:hypothetical protein n=1 Tax=Leptothrix ochracea TaxID=735331 RepID=UPI0034E1E548